MHHQFHNKAAAAHAVVSVFFYTNCSSTSKSSQMQSGSVVVFLECSNRDRQCDIQHSISLKDCLELFFLNTFSDKDNECLGVNIFLQITGNYFSKFPDFKNFLGACSYTPLEDKGPKAPFVSSSGC